MLVTLAGISTLVSKPHEEKASFPIVVNPSGIITLVSELHL